MTRKFTIASIMSALAIVCLFGSSYLPTGRIALLAITSMCVLATVVECGVRYAWIQYGATSLLALLLIPFKFQVLLFVALLGYYPVLKLHIEKIENLFFEWLVKILFFNALMIVGYFGFKHFLMQYISLGAISDIVLTNLGIVILVAEIVFIIYDYLLSFFAHYYKEIISKRLK